MPKYPLELVLRAVDQATATIRRVSSSVNKMGVAATKVGRNLTTSLTLPVVGIGAAAVKTFADFEQGMSAVSTLIDTNVESLDDISDKVLEIGRRTPVAVADLTAALYDARSAGVSAADQFEVLEQSARLAVAGLGTTQEALDLATGAVKNWKLEGDDALRIYDNIFKTVKFGKNTISDLSQGFGSVAPMIAASGTSIEEYLSSIAAMTSLNIPAAQAHTQVAAAIAGLSRNTRETSLVFRSLGVTSFKELIATSGGLVPALAKVVNAIDGNEAALKKLVGRQQAMTAVLSLTRAASETQQQAFEDMTGGVNAVDEAYEKAGAGVNASIQLTKNAMTDLGVTTGKVLGPGVERLAGKLADLADWFGNLDADTRNMILTMAGFAAAIGPVMFIGGKLLALVSLLASPIGLLAVGIAGLAYAAYELYQGWHLVEDFFSELWDGVKESFQDALYWIDSILTKILNKVADAIDRVKSFPGEVANAFSEYFGGGSGESDDIAAARAAALASAGAGLPRAPIPRAPGVAPGAPQNARVTIDIAGAPRGARARVDRGSDAEVDLSMGYALGTP